MTIPLAGFNLSGGVKSLCTIANALAARGHFVRVLAPDFACEPPIPLDARVRVVALRSGPRWLPLPVRKVVHLGRLAATAAAGCDVCLANYFTTAYAAWLSQLLRRSGAVLAYNIRGYEPESHGLQANASRPSRLARWALAAISYRLPLRKICTTAWLRDRVGDPSAFVVGHGIDLRTFTPPSAPRDGERVVVGTIGRAGEAKGYPDFLRAMRLVSRDLPIEVLVAAPDRVSLPEGVSARILRPSSEKQMADFYRSCEVFVFSSRGEGFGLPPLEAMACGCAVITTDCGGIREFAEHSRNCVVVPVRDPAALAQAIRGLVQDSRLRVRLSTAGRETARNWDREAVLERFGDYLEQLAATRRLSDGRPSPPASPGIGVRAP